YLPYLRNCGRSSPHFPASTIELYSTSGCYATDRNGGGIGPMLGGEGAVVHEDLTGVSRVGRHPVTHHSYRFRVIRWRASYGRAACLPSPMTPYTTGPYANPCLNG